MVCGGFACSKNALCALNVVYMLVGLLLIGVAAWGKGLGLVSSIHIIGGVIAVGVFLLLIAVAGLLGAVNHHQVLLFFYMIILGLVFIFQFVISCSCLAINRSKQTDVINASWWVLSNKTRDELERSFDCCGLFNLTTLYQQDYAFCTAICKSRIPPCQMCGEKFLKHSDEALNRRLGTAGPEPVLGQLGARALPGAACRRATLPGVHAAAIRTPHVPGDGVQAEGGRGPRLHPV